MQGVLRKPTQGGSGLSKKPITEWTPEDWKAMGCASPSSQLSVEQKLRAALAGYDAQYGVRSIADQHPTLPSGAVERIEAVVEAARSTLASTTSGQGWPDGRRVWICEPWHDEGEGYEDAKGTDMVVRASTKESAERQCREWTHAEYVKAVEVVPANLPSPGVEERDDAGGECLCPENGVAGNCPIHSVQYRDPVFDEASATASAGEEKHD